MALEKISKSQQIRLIDVFVLGPFMIYYGVVAQGMHPDLMAFMIFSGIMTILYNGQNYLINEGLVKK